MKKTSTTLIIGSSVAFLHFRTPLIKLMFAKNASHFSGSAAVMLNILGQSSTDHSISFVAFGTAGRDTGFRTEVYADYKGQKLQMIP